MDGAAGMQPVQGGGLAWQPGSLQVRHGQFHDHRLISYGQPDPSIFTVLTSPSDTLGTTNCDFVIFRRAGWLQRTPFDRFGTTVT